MGFLAVNPLSSPYKLSEKPVFRRPVEDAMSTVISSSVMNTPDCSNELVGSTDDWYSSGSFSGESTRSKLLFDPPFSGVFVEDACSSDGDICESLEF